MKYPSQTKKFIEQWDNYFHEQNKLKTLLIADGIITELHIEEISFHTDFYKELPVYPDANKALNTFEIVFRYNNQRIPFRIVERYQLQKRIADTEHYWLYDYLVNGKRIDAYKTQGRYISESEYLNLDSKSYVDFIKSLHEFDVWNSIHTLFKSEIDLYVNVQIEKMYSLSEEEYNNLFPVEKEPFMCDLCAMHEVPHEDDWCEDCVEEREENL